MDRKNKPMDLSSVTGHYAPYFTAIDNGGLLRALWILILIFSDI
jgi:hypothetical protein